MITTVDVDCRLRSEHQRYSESSIFLVVMCGNVANEDFPRKTFQGFGSWILDDQGLRRPAGQPVCDNPTGSVGCWRIH